MSISACVAPAVFFFERIEAIICPSVSIPIGRSTVISTSSAGARSSAPPQAMHAPVRSTTSRIRCGESATSASTPMVSAVPDGLVIARDEVFGTVRPSVARIGTTIMDVRLPGMPPMQCLSATTSASNSSREPQAIIASVKETSSAAVEAPERAGEHEHRQLGLRVAARADVGEDRVEVGARERLATQLAAHALDALRRTRMRRFDRRALGEAEVAERRLGEADLVAREQRVAAEVEHAAHLHGRRPVAAAADHAHAVERLEAERALRHRALGDEHDVLGERVDAHAA